MIKDIWIQTTEMAELMKCRHYKVLKSIFGERSKGLVGKLEKENKNVEEYFKEYTYINNEKEFRCGLCSLKGLEYFIDKKKTHGCYIDIIQPIIDLYNINSDIPYGKNQTKIIEETEELSTEPYGIIYKIRNKINNKVYIGQTTRTFNERYRGRGVGAERVYRSHLAYKKTGVNCNEHLIKSIEKYGFDNFEVDEEFDIAYSKQDLDNKEIYWIKYYNSTDFRYGYNHQEGGARGKRTIKSRFEQALKNNTLILCVEDKKPFISPTFASEYYGVNKSVIHDSVEKKRHIKYRNLSFIQINNKSEHMKKLVVDLDTFELYYCPSDIIKKYKGKCSEKGVRNCCIGSAKSTKIDGQRRHFVYVRLYKEKFLKDTK